MSRFFSEVHKDLTPYVPGEQPRDRRYVKLNTNESPFPPSPAAVRAAEEAARQLQLYPDPTALALRTKLAEHFGLAPDEASVNNGSDETLSFAFLGWCDEKTPALFPDITYGFYTVYAGLYRLPYEEIPLDEDFRIRVADYAGKKGTVFIANPNAQTGIALPLAGIEELLRQDPDRLVVVDEAYVDFGAESAVGLIPRYDNLLIIQTFSKSRSMAGGRLGIALGRKELIQDLMTLQFSFNPYNLNRMTMAAGIGALEDPAYFEENCRKIAENREWLKDALRAEGFAVTDSLANFLLARTDRIGGESLYRALKERGVLVRHLGAERIRDWVRITVGSREELEILMEKIRGILKEVRS